MSPSKRARVEVPPAIAKVISALLKVATTGNEATDGDREANREMLITLITECLTDESHIMSLHTALLKRKRSQTNENGPDLMEPFSILGRVPDADRIDALAMISDSTAQDIISAKRQDAEADKQLLTFGLGLGPSVKVADELRIRPIFHAFVRARSKAMGDRLAKFKQSGGINATTGALQWASDCYECHFSDKGVLDKVTHRGTGDIVTVPAWCKHVTPEWSLQNNWSDAQACLQIKPSPPIPLSSLWGDRKGPNSLQIYKGGKIKEIDSLISSLHRDYLQKLSQVTSLVPEVDGASTAEHLKKLPKQLGRRPWQRWLRGRPSVPSRSRRATEHTLSGAPHARLGVGRRAAEAWVASLGERARMRVLPACSRVGNVAEGAICVGHRRLRSCARHSATPPELAATDGRAICGGTTSSLCGDRREHAWRGVVSPGTPHVCGM